MKRKVSRWVTTDKRTGEVVSDRTYNIPWPAEFPKAGTVVRETGLYRTEHTTSYEG